MLRNGMVLTFEITYPLTNNNPRGVNWLLYVRNQHIMSDSGSIATAS